jgi:hypothetical protein
MDPYIAVKDILEASASLKVASKRLEMWLGLYMMPCDKAARLLEKAIDLDEMANQIATLIVEHSRTLGAAKALEGPKS